MVLRCAAQFFSTWTITVDDILGNVCSKFWSFQLLKILD